MVCLLLAACRTDEPAAPTNPTDKVTEGGGTGGFYLLNEGNMGSNSATLDWFDAAAGTYRRNIFGLYNPGVARGLGDVGNDLQINSSQLWAVINCSNLVEVMEAGTARHIGTVNVANCRYVAFDGGFAYVSSYAGEIGDKTERAGKVVKINAATLAVVGECAVGRQPEELAVHNGRLYVANSGGYTPEHYDRTVSVIDLATFSEVERIDVADNLHRLRIDARGVVWVSAREDGIYAVDGSSVQRFDVPCGDMVLDGDLLYACGSTSYTTIDTQLRQVVSTQPLTLTKPYGIAVNPKTHQIFITDAADYLTPGAVHCFSAEGVWLWRARTGNIPGRLAFVQQRLGTPNGGTEEPEIVKVFEYSPAPGQFVGEGCNATTPAQAAQWAQERLAEGGLVSLGAYGGYIVVGLSVDNGAGADFWVAGNAFEGSSEPGIVWVAQDLNANGLPDDPWHALRGSVDATPYTITYSRPADGQDVPWLGSDGSSGFIPRNAAHTQPQYFAPWLPSPLVLSGLHLPSNTTFDGTQWSLNAFAWGYADNLGSDYRAGAVHLDLDNAGLQHADFIKVQTASLSAAGALGELSTEVRGFGAIDS